MLAVLFFKLKPEKQMFKSFTDFIPAKSSSLINKDSLTIKSRVKVPTGYKRVKYPKGSFQEYLRHYKLKPFGSKIINYDDTEYYWQQGHIGVLDIPVPKNGL